MVTILYNQPIYPTRQSFIWPKWVVSKIIRQLLTQDSVVPILQKKSISFIETEWRHYKYLVLEHDALSYQTIRDLLKDKNHALVESFYNSIDQALQKIPTKGSIINAASHVFGYFKKNVTTIEKEYFLRLIDQLSNDQGSRNQIKDFLWELTNKYQSYYLKDSLYFMSHQNKEDE